MSLVFEERGSDSPFVETITEGYTIGEGFSVRPAEYHWHLVLTKFEGKQHAIIAGPLMTSGLVNWTEGAEILWIRFKLGTYMPHLPPKALLEKETHLPEAANQSFWLHSQTWQFPDYENADTFIDWLVREELLQHDYVINAALNDQVQAIPERTLRHRFVKSTGMTQGYIRQIERANQAVGLLRQGYSILDTVFEAGYFDQAHLSKSLKQFIGRTPSQILKELEQVSEK
jgi:AraC-like DNA-binding protein